MSAGSAPAEQQTKEVLAFILNPTVRDDEFTTDLEYQPSMDTAYHFWQQPRYDECRREFDRKFDEKRDKRTKG